MPGCGLLKCSNWASLMSDLNRVGNWGTACALMKRFAGAFERPSFRRPVWLLFVGRFVFSCSFRGVTPERCERPLTGGNRSCKNAVFSGRLCWRIEPNWRFPPNCSQPWFVLASSWVSLYSPTLIGFTRYICWYPPVAGVSAPTPRPGPTNCFSTGERLFIRPLSYMRLRMLRISVPLLLCWGAISPNEGCSCFETHFGSSTKLGRVSGSSLIKGGSGAVNGGSSTVAGGSDIFLPA